MENNSFGFTGEGAIELPSHAATHPINQQWRWAHIHGEYPGCAKSVFGHSLLEAGLTEQPSLLVAKNRTNGDGIA